ncbi:hypothetical protein HGRIS_011195 [Hohenbuehelia grisea]|uniref:Uncharacterized protein n=1 Tax=Hohenbuehelia grisea TaxID=104357 RepID=A0ABR3JWB2_9AGAR
MYAKVSSGLNVPIPSNFSEYPTRIREICTNPPRYEHSYYGPIDKILNTIFSGARFLVKPQALLRREEETASAIRLKTSVAEIDEYDNGEVDSLDDSERRKQQQQQGEGEEDEGEEEEEEETTLDEDDDFNLADTSFDSCGTPVVRTLRASSIPDFVVCSFAGLIGSDVVRIVIEIKPDDLNILAAVSQLNDYLEQAESRAATPSRLHGVLIIQNTVRIYQKNRAFYQLVQSWQLNGHRFYEWLESIAREDLSTPHFVHSEAGRWLNVSW